MPQNTIAGLNADHNKKFDEKTFEDLYRRMYPTLKKYAIYLVKDVEDAQLILNDVFISIWKNGTILNNEKAYLFRAVKNAATNYHKAAKANLWYMDSEEEFSEIIDVKETPSQAFQNKDRNRILYTLIDQMPERRRLIFYMYRIDGFSYREIAVLLDISVRTVEDHLVKGFQFLQQKVLENKSEFR